MKRAWWAILVALLMSLSGCLGDDDGGDDGDEGDDEEHDEHDDDEGNQDGQEDQGHDDADDTGGDDGGQDGGDGGHDGASDESAADMSHDGSIDQFEADVTEGEAPLAVTFTLAATSSDENATYELTFGDGTADTLQGDLAEMPESVEHTYDVGGDFSATLRVLFGDESVEDAIAITVTVPDAGPPPETHFELGPALGCMWDGGGLGPTTQCISELEGPEAPAIDGYWIALDERYWNAPITTTIDRGPGQCAGAGEFPWPTCDSDCFFYASDAATYIGEANNGGDACAGFVPLETGWLFITPYLVPATAMIVDFQV